MKKPFFIIEDGGKVVVSRALVLGNGDTFSRAVCGHDMTAQDEFREWLTEQGHDTEGVPFIENTTIDGGHMSELFYLLEPNMLFHFKLRFG